MHRIRRNPRSWVAAAILLAIVLVAALVGLHNQNNPGVGGGVQGLTRCPNGTVSTTSGVCTHGAITTTENTRGWLLRCDYSHTLGDDPIKFPGRPGASHVHDFFGNSSTSAGSTYASMTANTGTTCAPGQYGAGTAADTAAYWNPQVITDGVPVNPTQTSQQIYYRFKYAAGVHVEPFPPDIRIIVGNSVATSEADNPALVNNELYWECDGNPSTHYKEPPTTCPTGVTLENTVLPSCWDGVLTHQNDTAHVAYRPDFGSCPAGFPHALPQISIKIKYVVGKGKTITLSSGPTYTAHSDFWNTWNENGLTYLVDHCINGNESCGTNPIAPTDTVTATGTPIPTATAAPSVRPTPSVAVTASTTPVPTPTAGPSAPATPAPPGGGTAGCGPDTQTVSGSASGKSVSMIVEASGAPLCVTATFSAPADLIVYDGGGTTVLGSQLGFVGTGRVIIPTQLGLDYKVKVKPAAGVSYTLTIQS